MVRWLEQVDVYYCECMFGFCFKQKTAYEMRISDWSSDVCSSDLMRAAPLAVFAALAAVITVNGLDILLIYARFIASFYVGLGILWLILGMVAFLLIGRRRWTLAKHMRAPAMLAFSTASSAAAYPRTPAGHGEFWGEIGRECGGGRGG